MSVVVFVTGLPMFLIGRVSVSLLIERSPLMMRSVGLLVISNVSLLLDAFSLKSGMIVTVTLLADARLVMTPVRSTPITKKQETRWRGERRER